MLSTAPSLNCTTRPGSWRTDGPCSMCPASCTTCTPERRTSGTGPIPSATTTRRKLASSSPAYSPGRRSAYHCAETHSSHNNKLTPKTHIPSPHCPSPASIIIMIGRLQCLFRFGSVVGTGGNSINPVGQFVAYGHYFPKEWSQEFIRSQLDPLRRNLTEVRLMRNRLGRPTGKVLLRFASQEGMEGCIRKYNEDFIITKEEAHRVVIKPFELKTVAKQEQVSERRTKHAVKVKNLDFDISAQELQRVARDYGKVEFVEMQMRPNGLNNGIATVYFRKAKEAADFSYFCQDLVIRERKLNAEVVNFAKANKNEISYLQEPKITIEANERLYKRMLAEEVRRREEEKL